MSAVFNDVFFSQEVVFLVKKVVSCLNTTYSAKY